MAPDADSDLLLHTMDRDGGLVIEGLLSPDIVERIERELAPAVADRGPGFRPGFDDTFYGSNTVRVQGIAAKSRTFVDEYLLHPTLLDIADRVLLPYCGDYWLSQSETIYIGPGNERQALHRDDLNWNLAAQLRVPLQISVLVALGDYDAEVGATHVVPRSHRWPLDKPFDGSMSQQVELGHGDALVYLGSLLHGGGANVTTDRWRKALYLSYLVGWLTPEEAVPLGVGADVAVTLPPRAAPAPRVRRTPRAGHRRPGRGRTRALAARRRRPQGRRRHVPQPLIGGSARDSARLERRWLAARSSPPLRSGSGFVEAELAEPSGPGASRRSRA